MVTLGGVAIAVGWFVIGTLLGRMVFVHILGESARRDGRGYWTPRYSRAVWASLFCIPLWPIVVPILLMTSTTPIERLDRSRRELAAVRREVVEQEQQIKELARKHNLPNIGED